MLNETLNKRILLYGLNDLNVNKRKNNNSQKNLSLFKSLDENKTFKKLNKPKKKEK